MLFGIVNAPDVPVARGSVCMAGVIGTGDMTAQSTLGILEDRPGALDKDARRRRRASMSSGFLMSWSLSMPSGARAADKRSLVASAKSGQVEPSRRSLRLSAMITLSNPALLIRPTRLPRTAFPARPHEALMKLSNSKMAVGDDDAGLPRGRPGRRRNPRPRRPCGSRSPAGLRASGRSCRR